MSNAHTTAAPGLAEELAWDLGPEIANLLATDGITEIYVNADGCLRWQANTGRHSDPAIVVPPDHLQRAFSRLATSLDIEAGRDAVLECWGPAEPPIHGARFQIILPPLVPRPICAIRRHAPTVYPLETYCDRGLTSRQYGRLRAALADRLNILVAGATGSGKTSFLNALLRELHLLSPDERVVTLEDTRELRVPFADHVCITVAGADYTLRDAVRYTLRLLPDRLMVGEVRGPDAYDLLDAWSTGHPGFATVHADNADAALHRLERLAGLAYQQTDLRAFVHETVHLVVVLRRGRSGPAVVEFRDPTGVPS